MKTFRLSLLALMATAACLSVNAQPRMGTAAPQNFGPASFETFDRDGNGTISEAEFDAVRGERRSAAAKAGRPMRRAATSLTFKEIDRDGDGQLTREEFDGAHAAQPRTRQGARGAGMGRGAEMGADGGMGRGAGAGVGMGGAGPGMNQPQFADFDLNGDGSITEPEFHAARSGRITSRLQEGRQMRNLNAGEFADIDTNRDGRITPAEFAAHQAARRGGQAR